MIAVVVVALILIALLIGLGHFLNRRRMPSRPVDAALVFGTGLGWKAATRLRTAEALFDAGLIRQAIVSGGVPMHDGSGMTEAEWLKARLVAHGVPVDRVLVENRATNTHENAAFSLPIITANGIRSIVLVMSDFEGIRAYLTA